MELARENWAHFHANFSDGSTVAELLKRAYSGEPTDAWHDDLFQELLHQYTVSESAYPAAAHLVRLSEKYPEYRMQLMVLLGGCVAFSDEAVLDRMPDDVKLAWDQAAEDAIPLILSLLGEVSASPSALVYLFSALAACSGHPALARSIEALDYEPD
ncbi:MAG: hypothetical protein PVF85_07290 [Anaerolineales bacterium]|jgi:hypothetical protein